MALFLDPARRRPHPSHRVPLREPPPPPPVLGCDCIYQPTGLAWEYAPLAASPYRGCGHGCKYCYVPGYAVDNITPPARQGTLFQSGLVAVPAGRL
jgi:hypothetical protein